MKIKLKFNNSYLESISNVDYLSLNEENHYKTGFAAGTLFVKANYKIIKLLKNPFIKMILKFLYSKHKKRMQGIRVPEEYLEELRGYSESTKISYEHLLLINLRYEIRGCSGFAFLNPDGSLLVGHNTDASKILAKVMLRYFNPLIVSVQIPGKNKFVHVSYAFFIGAANGFNEQGIATSSHDSGSIHHKVVANNISAASLVRVILEKAQSIDGVSKVVQENFSYIPANILIASEKEHKFSVLEAYPSDFSFTVIANQSWVAVTNHYQSDKMQKYHKAIKKGSSDRLTCLHKILSGKNNFSIKEAIETLKDHRNGVQRDVTGYSIANMGTFQSFVLDVTKKDIYISNGNKLPVPFSGDFIKISTMSEL
ncbi:MAG: hypothetical protein EXS51_01670 [Candidatus Taylorbacteria bacterium]|nr:hypothetical protein [Candidatus Taylorbacteria bacterium]